jgi:GTP cyclohydrolase IA
VKIADWLAENVTTDARALAWFDAPNSEGRVARAYKELLSGYTVDPSKILKTTRRRALSEPPLHVTIRNISFYSLCAYHFLPFFGTIDLTYVPGDRVLGLGKFPRLVRAFARRFTIQEDLVLNVGQEVMTSGRARGVRVSSIARHLCMCSRGPSDDTVEARAQASFGCLEEPYGA